MPSTRTTILRWTGKGSLDDLRSSVEFVLGEEKVRALVSRIGDSLTLDGPEPLGLAALFGYTPGVSWVAAGLTARSYRELSSAARRLAGKYLKKGDGFAVDAEGTRGSVVSDVAGIVTSAVLDGVKGTRVSTESPRVHFRAAFDGQKGVVGVQVRKGPGGTPMGKEEVVCLVSGGIHSSVIAWEAVLQGFRVRLVHVIYAEESLTAVAGLYSELSHRSDPRGLTLEVLEGESVANALSGYVGSSKKQAFAGFSAGATQGRNLANVIAPLYLMSEEEFEAAFEGLGIKSYDTVEDWNKRAEGARTVRRFGARRADVSGVLDGLK
jgi:adenylyl- and sulfurtransferase ThiI